MLHLSQHPHAFSVVYPNIAIFYSLVLISSGQLPPATGSAVGIGVSGTLQFTWEDNSLHWPGKHHHKAVLVAYALGVHQCAFSYTTGKGIHCVAVLDVSNLEGLPVKTWISYYLNYRNTCI